LDAALTDGFHVPNTGRIIAVVDDDESVRDAMKGLVRSLGFATEVFSSAEEFLRSPDMNRTGCLIVDFNMPHTNGLDLHNYLSLQGKAIPTILVTAYPRESVRTRALRAGVLCYLTKPFEQNDLLHCIQSALDRSQDHGNTG
jgi:FixJ family two-component response regulator